MFDFCPHLIAGSGVVVSQIGVPDARPHKYDKGFDAGPLSGRGRVPEFLRVFAVIGGFPRSPDRLSYTPALF